MKVDDLWLYSFTKEVNENSSLLCPNCKEYSNVADWYETLVYCEDCGDHFAIGCSKCDYAIDHVRADTIKVKDNEMQL